MDIPDYNQGVIRILGGDELYAAELSAVWERAYFAALTGLLADGVRGQFASNGAAEVADSTVAGWPFGRDDTVRKAVEG